MPNFMVKSALVPLTKTSWLFSILGHLIFGSPLRIVLHLYVTYTLDSIPPNQLPIAITGLPSLFNMQLALVLDLNVLMMSLLGISLLTHKLSLRSQSSTEFPS